MDNTRVKICAGLLAQHHNVHLMSCGLTASGVLALLVMLIGSTGSAALAVALAAIILLGTAETVLSIRVGFDKELWTDLARKPTITGAELAALDDALSHFRLRKTGNAKRSLESRLSGSLRLFKRQTWLCGAQVVLILCTVGFYGLKGLSG